jgi:hypothetical protein
MEKREIIAHYSSRRAQRHALVKAHPQQYDRCLYIGAKYHNRKLPALYKRLRQMCKRLICYEAFDDNVKGIEAAGLFDEVLCADISFLLNMGIPIDDHGDAFDLIVWWHGPEHCDFYDTLCILRILPEYATYFWTACPWGYSPQKAVYGNEYEEHRSSLYPEDFLRLGFNVTTAGHPDSTSTKGQIVAWR